MWDYVTNNLASAVYGKLRYVFKSDSNLPQKKSVSSLLWLMAPKPLFSATKSIEELRDAERAHGVLCAGFDLERQGNDHRQM